MKARIGFAIIVGVGYLFLGFRASFGVTSVDFWSSMVCLAAMLAVLPIAIFSIWKPRVAGWILIIDAGVMVCAGIVSSKITEGLQVGVALALPVILSALLLLKKSEPAEGGGEEP